MASDRATVGDTKFSAVLNDHMGWLKCDGRVLSVADYNLLFQVIGYSFSATKSGPTFTLPDAQGRVPAAIGSNGESTRKLGDVSGSETHTLTIAEMPAHKHGSADVTGNTDGNGNTTTNGAHTHGVNDSGHSHNITVYDAGSSRSEVGRNTSLLGGNTASTQTAFTGISIQSDGAHFHTMGSTGGGAPHNTIQPTIWMGSMFIFSGVLSAGSYPFTTGTNII